MLKPLTVFTSADMPEGMAKEPWYEMKDVWEYLGRPWSKLEETRR